MTKDTRDLDKLVAEAKARYDAMTPEQKEAHDKAQRESWVRGMLGDEGTTLIKPSPPAPPAHEAVAWRVKWIDIAGYDYCPPHDKPEPDPSIVEMIPLYAKPLPSPSIAEAVRAEREACAKVAEDFAKVTAKIDGRFSTTAIGMTRIAAAIRSRPAPASTGEDRG